MPKWHGAKCTDRETGEVWYYELEEKIGGGHGLNEWGRGLVPGHPRMNGMIFKPGSPLRGVLGTFVPKDAHNVAFYTREDGEERP